MPLSGHPHEATRNLPSPLGHPGTSYERHTSIARAGMASRISRMLQIGDTAGRFMFQKRDTQALGCRRILILGVIDTQPAGKDRWN
jgi:hypothetical protein